MTPELSMQDIVWHHLHVDGGEEDSIQLPQPAINRGYYRDIAVLAYPTLPGESQSVASLNPKVSSNMDGLDWSAALDGDPTYVDLP